MRFRSHLERVLKSGYMAITCEFAPPKNASLEPLKKKARVLKGYVDAANVTDCQVAMVRLSSLAGCLALMSEGIEPILQMTCRDRNRIAMQSDLLGAWALGIKNLFCTTGDHPKFGNHPEAKPVFDLDSVQLIAMVNKLKEGKFLNGEEIKGERPAYFLGATENPFADPTEYRVRRLAKKIRAGAEFIQTQLVYDVTKFKQFMYIAHNEGLTEKAYILAGIVPPKSFRMIEYIKSNLPGSCVPEDLVKRMREAKDPLEEGIQIAVELIEKIKEIPGVRGFHLMAIGWEEYLPEILKKTGFYPRPLPPEDLVEEQKIFSFKDEDKRQLEEEIKNLKAHLLRLETLITGKKEEPVKERPLEKPVVSVMPKEPVLVKEPEAKTSAPKPEPIKIIKGEYRSVSERIRGLPEELYRELSSGKIREIFFGKGDKALNVGGAEVLPFHGFEGNLGQPLKVAMEVLDVVPEDYPEVVAKYFRDVWHDPGAWAKKCVEEYGAEAICVYLLGTDPNYLDLGPDHAKKVIQKVREAVEVPLIIWGSDNPEKDTEVLKEVAEVIKDDNVFFGPIVEENYRTLGAVALGYQLPVIAQSPIDVNIAKQLNILLENLGVPLEKIIMDPSVGALGYGLEYTYSVMERIRLAALYANDQKLQNPFICNIGREVWKTKEVSLPSDELMGEAEMRGVMMETITALCLALAGGELFILRHPKTVALTKKMFSLFWT
ncbi:acetyl-CoA decarbonylase/synthase complex subunit delta [Thermodesulfobacterium sp. TA1]|uniref:acetyl-CoA decarbonylase/synthase complex subunit delta n=1 Tax=Thermodesulfobacterium sp. TA1 TaxID=2234087 RepID=UPI001232C347|nr:acetyl-CoA decarbonylase/synthase complex subunit delta [Thermodesulfobacterium sp. TA1]QER42798.1 acetyl-CoA decarbonylase/synthase complex subunit delta [Thermodesulfobacterium sp. TA1]